MPTPEEMIQEAADSLNESATRADTASQQLYDVSNGDENSTVSTDNGPVDTVAKTIKEIKDQLIGATLAATIEEQTLSSGQTTIVLNTISSFPRPLIYIEGSFEQDFTVVDEETIELGTDYPAGTRIWFLQNTAITDLESNFVQTLGSAMSIDSNILGAKTLGTDSEATIKITIEGTDYFIPAYTTSP